MLIEAYTAEDLSFHWLDVVDPTGGELEYISEKYALHQSSIQDCLDPKHLPKYETLENYSFIMLRSFDDKSRSTARKLRELTRKVAIIVGSNYIITIHRRDQPFIAQIRDRWVKDPAHLSEDPKIKLLIKLIHSVIFSYGLALNQGQNKLEEFEEVIFNEESSSESIQDKFLLKRRVYVFKRVLKLTLDILPKIKVLTDNDQVQELKEMADAAYFESENILEHVNNLINLHLSLASHHTSEVVRVLTLFSVFFMPLMFISGLYGMNFEHIPELKWQWGYPFVLGLMLLICIILFFWFRRKGWLR